MHCGRMRRQLFGSNPDDSTRMSASCRPLRALRCFAGTTEVCNGPARRTSEALPSSDPLARAENTGERVCFGGLFVLQAGCRGVECG